LCLRWTSARADLHCRSWCERSRGLSADIEPCLPRPAKKPPAGPDWIHEIKHDGFRIMARRDAGGVRLITRAGNDFASRFPAIGKAVAALPARTCVIDGEAIVCDGKGLAVFELIRGYGIKATAALCAVLGRRISGGSTGNHSHWIQAPADRLYPTRKA
jgi:ATP-dependent DNA ligase